MLPHSNPGHFNSEIMEPSVEMFEVSSDTRIDLEKDLSMVLTQEDTSFMGLSPFTTVLTENSQSGGFEVSQMVPSSGSGAEDTVEPSWGSLSSTMEDCSVTANRGSPDLLLGLVEDTIGSLSRETPYESSHKQYNMDYDPWGQGEGMKFKQEAPFNLDPEDLGLPLDSVKQEIPGPCDNGGFMYNCSDCDCKFSSPKSFRGHLGVHLRRLQNSCALCDAQLPSKKCLQDHIRQHFLQNSSAKCPLCHKGFSSKHLLRRHTQLSHPVLKTRQAPLKCDICDAVFCSKFGLKAHVATHNALKPYVCSECGATFTQNGSLQVHLRRHKGEKPFQCSLCGNYFTRAYSLKVHMKSHTGEKPFRCEYCGTRFVTSSHLTVHHRTHTGERPYTCEECGATFITTSHLKVHKRHHANHSMLLYQSVCTVCGASFSDPMQLRQHKKCAHQAVTDGR